MMLHLNEDSSFYEESVRRYFAKKAFKLKKAFLNKALRFAGLAFIASWIVSSPIVPDFTFMGHKSILAAVRSIEVSEYVASPQEYTPVLGERIELTDFRNRNLAYKALTVSTTDFSQPSWLDYQERGPSLITEGRSYVSDYTEGEQLIGKRIDFLPSDTGLWAHRKDKGGFSVLVIEGASDSEFLTYRITKNNQKIYLGEYSINRETGARHFRASIEATRGAESLMMVPVLGLLGVSYRLFSSDDKSDKK